MFSKNGKQCTFYLQIKISTAYRLHQKLKEKALRSFPKCSTYQPSKKSLLLRIPSIFTLARLLSLHRVERTCVTCTSSSKPQKIYKKNYVVSYPLIIPSPCSYHNNVCSVLGRVTKNMLYKKWCNAIPSKAPSIIQCF